MGSKLRTHCRSITIESSHLLYSDIAMSLTVSIRGRNWERFEHHAVRVRGHRNHRTHTVRVTPGGGTTPPNDTSEDSRSAPPALTAMAPLISRTSKLARPRGPLRLYDPPNRVNASTCSPLLARRPVGEPVGRGRRRHYFKSGIGTKRGAEVNVPARIYGATRILILVEHLAPSLCACSSFL